MSGTWRKLNRCWSRATTRQWISSEASRSDTALVVAAGRVAGLARVYVIDENFGLSYFDHSLNRPGHRIVAWLGKAALKTHALQTLRDCWASPNHAKRLECVRFFGA